MQNNILKNYIEQSGLSLRELSEKSGINISRLSRAQNSIKPSIELTFELAVSLGQKTLTVEGNEVKLGIYLKLENVPLNGLK